MIRMAQTFLIVAMIAAVLGFGLIADVSLDAAKVLFFVFLGLAAVTFVADAFRGGGRMIDPA